MEETVAILKDYLLTHGCDASELSCADDRIILHQIPEDGQWKWKILEIFVDGTKLICKSEIRAPGAMGGGVVILDLHHPDSLYKLLGVVQDIKEQASKRSPIEEMAKHLVKKQMFGKTLRGRLVQT